MTAPRRPRAAAADAPPPPARARPPVAPAGRRAPGDGPPAGRALDRDRVLDAALAVLDEQGLAGVSMRTVAARLGVEAMSLYHHVGSKNGLLDGLHERVLAELPPPRRTDGTWAASLRERALALRAALRRHPEAIPLFASRPAVTLASLTHVEHALGVLRAAGKTPAEALGVFQSVVALVVGHAALTLVPSEADGPDYESLDATGFPRVTEAARQLDRRDVEAEFRRALDAMLRGFEGG